MELSIYDRLGGSAAVHAIVEAIYRRMLEDPEMATFFEGVEMVHMKRSQRVFMAHALGGPLAGHVPDLAEAHAGLVKYKGLSDAHYDTMLVYVRESLDELMINPEVCDEVIALIESVREMVLGRAAKSCAA